MDNNNSNSNKRRITTRSNVEQKFKQQRSQYVPESEPDKFVGAGTVESPLSLSDSDDDDDNKNGVNKSKQRKNKGDTADLDLDDDNVQIQEPPKTMVDPDNIYLAPKHIGIGQYPAYTSDQRVVFGNGQIEITVPFNYLSSSSINKDCEVTVPYKHLKEFLVSCFKDFVNIDILTTEFYYKKTWIVKPTQLRNYDYGITNTISLKGISREQFEAMKPYLEKKSTNLKISMEIEDHCKLDKIIAYYPHVNSTKEIKDKHDIVKITYQDKSRLEPNQYLNDSLIDFYIRYIKDHFIQDQDKNRFYFFNTFFYNILTQQNRMDEAFKRIRKWTKKVDIFSYDFVFIPICEGSHWTLIILSFPGQDIETSTTANKPLIIFLDSLNHQRLGNINKKIREYLSMEWYARKVEPSNGTVAERKFNAQNLPLVRANVPKQDNLFDCGVFLLHYIELFCRNPETNFDKPLDRPAWFKVQDIITKREVLKTIIEKLELEQQLDLDEKDDDVVDDDEEEEEENKMVLDNSKKAIASKMTTDSGNKMAVDSGIKMSADNMAVGSNIPIHINKLPEVKKKTVTTRIVPPKPTTTTTTTTTTSTPSTTTPSKAGNGNNNNNISVDTKEQQKQQTSVIKPIQSPIPLSNTFKEKEKENESEPITKTTSSTSSTPITSTPILTQAPSTSNTIEKQNIDQIQTDQEKDKEKEKENQSNKEKKNEAEIKQSVDVMDTKQQTEREKKIEKEKEKEKEIDIAVSTEIPPASSIPNTIEKENIEQNQNKGQEKEKELIQEVIKPNDDTAKNGEEVEEEDLIEIVGQPVEN